MLLASSVIPAFITPGCGGSDADKRGLGTVAGKANAGTGGTMAPHIGTGGSGTAGAAARGASGGAAMTGGTGNGALGGTSSGATGGADDAAGASGEANPPGPTDDGLSPYSVPCNESTPCSDPARVGCLGIKLDEGTRYTCSNDCRRTADCSDAPSGTNARAQCVQFTQAKHCVLVCYDNGAEADCPDGMGCSRLPNAPIGYCLSL